jgi:MFS family permease
MQRIALPWLIYEMTGSPFLLGIVGFANYIPTVLLAPIAGVMIDRYSKLKIIKLMQFLEMIQALMLAFLVLAGLAQVWHIVLLSLFAGAIKAFEIPGRQSFYIQLIDNKEDLPNAIALNSIVFHLSRFLGPSLAGFIIAVSSAGICFLINGLSYIAVIISLFAIRINDEKISQEKKTIAQEIKEGVNYISSNPVLKNILILVGAISLFGWSYTILLPIFAKDVLGGGPLTFGFLNSATAVGAIIGAFYAASRRDLSGLKNRAVLFTFIFGVAIILFSFSNLLWFSLLFIGFAGLGAMLHNTSANSFVQTAVDDNHRGKVMSFYAFAHQGLMPVGSLILGWSASQYTAPIAMMTAGIFCLLSALFLGPRILASAVKNA